MTVASGRAEVGKDSLHCVRFDLRDLVTAIFACSRVVVIVEGMGL